MKSKKVTTKKELIENNMEIWEAFPQDKINNLILSFKWRLGKILENNGESISELLCRGINIDDETYVFEKIPGLLEKNDIIEQFDPTVDDEPIEFMTKRKYSEYENLLLLQLVRQIGKKWKNISVKFENRTPQFLRNRWNYLHR